MPRSAGYRMTRSWAPFIDGSLFFVTRAFFVPQAAADLPAQQDFAVSPLACCEQQLEAWDGHVACCAGQLDLAGEPSLPSPACSAGTSAKATNVRLRMIFFISEQTCSTAQWSSQLRAATIRSGGFGRAVLPDKRLARGHLDDTLKLLDLDGVRVGRGHAPAGKVLAGPSDMG
jgi:hypothetical protein